MNDETIYKSHDGEFTYTPLMDCPFCGSAAVIHFIGNRYSKSRKVEVKCSECRVKMINAAIYSDSEKLAKWTINAWNKRFNNTLKNQPI